MFVHLGPDRVEFWDPIQRPFRMGAWDQVTTSDVALVRQFVKAADWHRANDIGQHYYYPNSMFMCYAACEWLSKWPNHLRSICPSPKVQAVFQKAHRTWVVKATSRAAEDPPVLTLISMALMPEQMLNAELPVDYGPIWNQPREIFQSFQAALDNQDQGRAVQQLEAFHASARLRHDLLLEYLAMLVNTVLEDLGQSSAEQALSATMQACTFNEAMWRVCEKLTPHELAAVLAEHLRFHFSGPDREGTVQVIEEADRIQLVFDACGSGGAMRRRLGQGKGGLAVMPEASGSTWGLKGCVPGYCTHCAQNEMASIRRLGYPAWVTEFKEDPQLPCGWTIFKDPKAIPDLYFERLGLKRERVRAG